METPSPVDFGNLMFAAYCGHEFRAASGAPPTPPADNDDEDIDGCCVEVEVPTSDEDLPAAEGGVA